MAKAYRHTTEINELALELKRDSISLSDNPDNPKINRFMELLSDYANNLFFRSLPIRDTQEREDMVQKACITAIKYFDKFDPDKGSYSSLFYTNCSNVRTDEIRKKLGRETKHGKIRLASDIVKEERNWSTHLASNISTPLEELIQTEEHLGLVAKDREQGAIIEKLLGPESPLTPRQKEILGLRAKGLTNKEVAEKLGVTKQAPSAVMKYIKLKLEKMLEEEGKNPDFGR